MKTNELMIGDWVMDITPVVIDAISNEDVCTYRNEYDYVTANPSNLKPIPLTTEILEKNGFENDFYEDESVADYVKVRLEGYSLRCKANGWDDALVTWCNGHLEVVTDFNGEVRKDIEHIHQLQHALRLCGINKEIVI